MTRKKFIIEYTRFIKRAEKLAYKAQEHGASSLDSETEDIDDELFKEGLRLVVDEIEPRFIDEILSNRIAHEKDKHLRLFKSVQKRAVLGIQAGENVRILMCVLNSLAGLTKEEEWKTMDLLVAE